MPFESVVTQQTIQEADAVGNDNWTQKVNCKQTGKVANHSVQRLYRRRMKARLEDLQAKVTKYQQRAVAKADKSEKSSPSRLDFNKTQAADSITSPLGDSNDEGEFRDHLTEHKKILRPSQTLKRAIDDSGCHAPSKTRRSQCDNDSTAMKKKNSLQNSHGVGDESSCIFNRAETVVGNFANADTAKERRGCDSATPLNRTAASGNVVIVAPSQTTSHTKPNPLLVPPAQVEAYSYSPPFGQHQIPDMSGFKTAHDSGSLVDKHPLPDISKNLPLSSNYPALAIDSDLFADFMNEFVVQDETTDLQTGRPSNFLALPPNPQAATILPLTDPLHVPVHPPTPSNWSPHSSGTAAAKNQGSEFDSAGLVAPPLEALSLPDKSAMIEDRMAYVLEGAKAVGFQTFDESIVAYYTTCFDEVPSLYDQQRLSRGRRLPQFLAACCGAARGWSDWERRGFQGEILQGAEDTLVRELKTFKSSASFSEWLGMAHDRSASMCEGGEDKECEIKRKVQDELPNFWALIMALITKNKAFQPKDNSGAVFRVITTLCCAAGEHNRELSLDEFVHYSASCGYITPS